MKFKVELNKVGIGRTVNLEDSIINARKVLKYQKKIDDNFSKVDEGGITAYSTAQSDTLEDVVSFLTDMLDLSENELTKLESHSYMDVSKIAGSICRKVLRTDEDEEDTEDGTTKK